MFDADVILPMVPAKETADNLVLEAELVAQLDDLLTRLSPKYREVIVLHYFEHLSYEEISIVLKVSVNTVGVRMTRARTKLREIMQQQSATNGL